MKPLASASLAVPAFLLAAAAALTTASIAHADVRKEGVWPASEPAVSFGVESTPRKLALTHVAQLPTPAEVPTPTVSTRTQRPTVHVETTVEPVRTEREQAEPVRTPEPDRTEPVRTPEPARTPDPVPSETPEGPRRGPTGTFVLP